MGCAAPQKLTITTAVVKPIFLYNEATETGSRIFSPAPRFGCVVAQQKHKVTMVKGWRF